MVNLKKTLNLLDVSLATAGYIIGAGIYTIIGIASKYGKNYTWISVILSGILAICTGLSYSELASMYNKNSGNYIYIKEAFNKTIANYSVYIILTGQLLIQTTVSLGLGEHIHTFIPIHPKVIAGSLISLSAYLNYSGIRRAMDYNNIATILEIGGLLLISFLGFYNFDYNTFNLSSVSSEIYPILMGASIINFAYTGYDAAIQLSEETHNESETIPKGLLYGIILTIILYTLVTISATSSLGWEKLSKSKTPIADVASKMLGNHTGKIMLFIALASMSNTLLMGNISSSRFIQSISKSISLPFNLDKIDKNTRTPVNAIVIFTIGCIITLFMGNLEKITTSCNIATVLIFILINMAVIRLRLKLPNKKRNFKIPININNIPVSAIIGIIFSIIFSYVSIYHILD
jgi:basic amino acid/polyamine antiporter, APA family